MSRARDVATQGGLVLLVNQSFTAASTIDITNCFNSTYKNYMLKINQSAASTTSFLTFRFLNGTTPFSSDYYTSYSGRTSNNADASYGLGGGTSAYFAESNSTYPGFTGSQVTFFGPNTTTHKSWVAQLVYDTGSGGATRSGGGFVVSTIQFNGLRIMTNSGNITGTVQIYGIRN